MSRGSPLILFVSPVADLKGGAERVLLDMLDNPGIRPALALPGEGELSRIARGRGMPVSFFDLGAVERVRRPATPAALLRAAGGAVAAARQVARSARDLEAAAVHTNGLKVHVVGALARVLGGARVVAHVHDIPYSRLERAVWRGVAMGATRTLVVSPPCWPGPASPRVAVVMNGSTHPPAPAPRTLRGPPVLGFVGRFHPFKGLHVLADWLAPLSADETAGATLVVRGRASAESADYWAALRPRLAALGDRCRLEGWRGDGADPYEGLDLLVVPSKLPDPAPLVIMEAMLRGIPVVGYDAGGIPMLLGGTGRLVRDRESFAAAVRSLADPDAYAAASAAALERARARFGLPRFWASLNAQYARAGVAVPDPDGPDQEAPGLDVRALAVATP